MRSELKSGAWVEYLPVGELKARHKDVLTAVVNMEMIPGDAGGVTDDMDKRRARTRAELKLRDARWAMLITAWSWELQVPEWDADLLEVRNAASIGELPPDDYGDIEDLLTPHALILLRRPDPKAGTTSSSNGSSPAKVRASRTA